MYHRLRGLFVLGLLSLASVGFSAAIAGPASAAAPEDPQQERVVPISRTIVIGQVSTQGPGGRFDEFIELENIGAESVDIFGYTLFACNAQNRLIPLVTVQAELPFEPVVLEPGERWLIANLAGYTRGLIPNQTFSTGGPSPMLAEIQNRGGVLLRAATEPGVPATGQYVDAVGFSPGLQCTETAPARPQLGFLDQANLRVNPVDTNVNRRDFILYGPTSAINRAS